MNSKRGVGVEPIDAELVRAHARMLGLELPETVVPNVVEQLRRIAAAVKVLDEAPVQTQDHAGLTWLR